MRLQPQRAGGDGRIDTGLLPPSGFIATAMDLAVVAPAQRHGELIAHFSPERAVLREPQMMGIGGPAAANQARLFGDELDVVLCHESGAARDATNWLLSMPLATDVLPAGSGDRRSTDEDGWSADKTGDNGASPMSAAVPNDASLAWNASSTCRASAAIKLFFAPRIRCAQVVASSDEAIA